MTLSHFWTVWLETIHMVCNSDQMIGFLQELQSYAEMD